MLTDAIRTWPICSNSRVGFESHHIKLHIVIKMTVCYDAQTRDLEVLDAHYGGAIPII